MNMDTHEQAIMDEIQQRILWLATNMIEHANHVRPNPDGAKVVGTRLRARRW